jgi:hypothetical protein
MKKKVNGWDGRRRSGREWRDRGVDEEWDPKEAKADDLVGLLKEATPIDDTKQLLPLVEHYFETNR